MDAYKELNKIFERAVEKIDNLNEIDKLKKLKDTAYWERNQLVAALSKIFPAWLAKHPIEDKEWEHDWRTIVFMRIPNVSDFKDATDFLQISWHIHDRELPMFDHLEYRENNWDGHTTEEKYKRLRRLKFNKNY